MRIYFFPDGRPSSVPTDRETAKRKRTTKYDEGARCPESTACSIKYTRNDYCIHCARLRAIHAFNLASGAAQLYPSGWILTNTRGGTKDLDLSDSVTADLVKFQALVGERPPVTPEQAIAAGATWFVGSEACAMQGHIGLRTLTNECWYCRQAATRPSPRQAAIDAGDKWYTPDEPCDKCGQRAPKRVENGKCRGCNPSEGDGRATASSEFMRACPDAVLSRADAGALGLKVFRTGAACSRGHTAFRYVSTGGCLECK